MYFDRLEVEDIGVVEDKDACRQEQRLILVNNSSHGNGTDDSRYLQLRMINDCGQYDRLAILVRSRRSRE